MVLIKLCGDGTVVQVPPPRETYNVVPTAPPVFEYSEPSGWVDDGAPAPEVQVGPELPPMRNEFDIELPEASIENTDPSCNHLLVTVPSDQSIPLVHANDSLLPKGA